MILSDSSIKYYLKEGYIVINPEPSGRAFQPASLEMRLGNKFTFLHESTPDGRKWSDLYLEPGGFVLAHTLEHVTLPHNIVAIVNGKSSLARIGLAVHVTAGFVDPGFHGEITLELLNVSKQGIWLVPGEPIAQLAFMMTTRSSERPYGHPELGSHYQGQLGATGSRWRHEHP